MFLLGRAELSIAEESRLVSVGDHRLEVLIQGVGNHTVVFESGLGYDLDVWRGVAETVGRSARVITYSRAGYGKSDVSQIPRTVDQIATELDILLRELKIEKPIILVGHSAGGFYIRKYAQLHPDSVEGLVFVDPTPEQILIRLRDIDRERALQEEATMASMMPDRVKPEDEHFSKITKSGVYPNSGELPDVPTVLITAMKQEYPQFLLHSIEGKNIWLALQTNLISQFSDRLHIVSSDSGHNVHREHPELVVDAIEYVVRQTNSVQSEE